MNRTLKKLLGWTGLNRIGKVPGSEESDGEFDQRFGDIDQHLVQTNAGNVLFSTKDAYSKKWFYPRYFPNLLHEPSATELLLAHLKTGSTVLDIGAHLGYFGCVAAATAIDGAVHCFEMDQQCIPLIESNRTLNNFTNLTIHHAGIGAETGIMEIPALDNPDPGLSINGRAKQRKTVARISIDHFASENEIVPDFIKIDVEGAELEVLQGMTSTLNNPNLKLLIEIHPWNLRKLFRTDYKAVLRLLEQADFLIQLLPDHRSGLTELLPISANSNIDGNSMIFCSKA